jgi:4-carboxymuconolactone decarboxylase
MTTAERALIQLSAAVASGRDGLLASAIDEAHQAALPGAAEEVLLQTYLFLGFPTTLRALQAWRERTGTLAERSVAEDCASWRERGERVCEQIYGGQYDRLRSNVSRLHPELERWMLEEGYGKVLDRPGLSLRMRELCIIPLLVAQDAPRPLYAHLRGALNAGAVPDEVESALAMGCAHVSALRAAAACGVWESVLRRRTEV